MRVPRKHLFIIVSVVLVLVLTTLLIQKNFSSFDSGADEGWVVVKGREMVGEEVDEGEGERKEEAGDVTVSYRGGTVKIAELGCSPSHESDRRCLPHAVVAGFPKGGTAQLNAALGACHPQIKSSIGEINMKTSSELAMLHRSAKVYEGDNLLAVAASPIVSEMKSTDLLYLSKMVPNLKLIYLLRDPAGRDYSHFKMFIRHNNFHVPFPPGCFDDTNECFLNMMMDFVVLPMEAWSFCAGATNDTQLAISEQLLSAKAISRSGSNHYTEEDYKQLIRWSDIAPLEQWVQCIKQNPKFRWAEESLLSKVTVSDYLSPLEKSMRAFGENNVRWYQSEVFFEYHQGMLSEIVSFLGLYPHDALAKCFRATGNFKKGIEEDLFDEMSITVTSMSDQLRSLLVAMHRPHVAHLEQQLGYDFHWFDQD